MTAFVRRFSLLLIGALFTTLAGATTPYLVDGDGDAVSDEIDDCPYTHVGVKVDAKGCPMSRDDADFDGVPDDGDDCPYSASGALIDVHGCAIDGDFDGVADGIDRCPRSSLALPVDLKGCAAGEQALAVAVAPRSVPAPAAQPVAAEAAIEKVAVIPLPVPVESLPPAMTRPKAAVPPEPGSPAAPVSISANAPVVASNANPADAPRLTLAEAPETPEFVLHFLHNSGRLGAGDLAVIDTYVRIFARRLIAEPASKLRLRAFADLAETDIAGLAQARLAIVRTALIQRGIRPERIKPEAGQMDGGDAANNRRVEVRLVTH